MIVHRVAAQDLNEVLITKEYRLEEQELQEGTKPKLPPGSIGILRFATIQEGDRLNQNKRIYPWDTLREVAADFKGKVLANEPVPGFDGHPADDQGYRAGEVAVVLKDYDLDEAQKKIANGVFLIPDTARGRDVLALARLGVPLGVSSRAQGTVQEGEINGQRGSIVQKDLRLRGWDLVLNPSVSTAKMTSLQESRKMPKTITLPEGDIKLEWLKENAPEVFGALNTKNVLELRKLVPDTYKGLITEALQLSRRVLTSLAEVEVASREEAIREAAEAPLLNRIENLTEALRTANDKSANLNEATNTQVALIRDELESTKRQLNEQMSQNRANSALLEEVRSERVRSQVKAAVMEATQGHPLAEMLQVAVLGANPAKGGVRVGKQLTEAYGDVEFPNSVEEALKAVKRQKALLEATGVSTQRGHSQADGDALRAKDFDEHEARLSGARR